VYAVRITIERNSSERIQPEDIASQRLEKPFDTRQLSALVNERIR
jgi:hypothetical protein